MVAGVTVNWSVLCHHATPRHKARATVHAGHSNPLRTLCIPGIPPRCRINLPFCQARSLGHLCPSTLSQPGCFPVVMYRASSPTRQTSDARARLLETLPCRSLPSLATSSRPAYVPRSPAAHSVLRMRKGGGGVHTTRPGRSMGPPSLLCNRPAFV